MNRDYDAESDFTRVKRQGVQRIGNRPPPVDQRPKCPNCRRPLRPDWHTVKWGSLVTGEPRIVRWTGKYKGYRHFDTLTCCMEYANNIIDIHRRRNK